LARSRKSQRKETVSAQVFLRSVSGRSARELATGPLPSDLGPFRAPQAARTTVQRFLADAGFKVYADESGLTLSIEGPPANFARAFGADAARVAKVSARETLALRPPAEIAPLVEEIVVLPKPELF
jgi:hypothetical protein